MKQISDTYSFPFVVIYRDIIADGSDKLVSAPITLRIRVKFAELATHKLTASFAIVAELVFITTHEKAIYNFVVFGLVNY